MTAAIRIIILMLGLLLLWQLLVSGLQLPAYILPGPILVIKTWWQQLALISNQAVPTIIEILLGLFFGALIGMLGALSMIYFQVLRFWLMPMLIISQAIPTFAIAPLLVIWFGYGMTAKIITTMIMLFFPVTSAFFDGLRHTPEQWLDLAKTMNATKWRTLWLIRIPAALPSLASGLRVATVAAPIGAIVGEWVGSSRGLGFLMLDANARMQIALMFATLFTIVILALALYFSVDKLLKWAIPWQVEK